MTTAPIYIAQIILLCADAFMVWRARKAFNGLWWELIVLFVSLAIRRVDDMIRNADEIGILILSSVVVTIVTHGIYRIYRDRKPLEFYLINRHKREAELEALRQRSERNSGDWNQAYKKVP